MDASGRIARLWTGAALLVFNTLIALLALNAGIALLSESEAAPRPWLIEAYGLERLKAGYPGWEADSLELFLGETSRWVQQYEPFTQFRPQARSDRFITISEHGFRPVGPDQGPWPPDADHFSIFVFGGSTTMGAGVPDDQTIPSHLSRIAARCSPEISVYNFGRGFYFSTQERILFERLILEGRRPQLAVFIDGLNDFYFSDGKPEYTERLSALMSEPELRPGQHALEFARGLPMGRIIEIAAELQHSDASEPPGDSDLVAVIERWLVNRELIQAAADRFGIGTVFVWQPVPTYAYDLTHHGLYEGDPSLFGRHAAAGRGYALMDARYRAGLPSDRVLWLADMQRDRTENLYVDAVHYTSAMSAEIALEIYAFLTERELLPCS